MGLQRAFDYQSVVYQNVIRGVARDMTQYPNQSKQYIYKNSNYDFIQVRMGT